MMAEKVIVRMNVLGIDLEQNQVDAVLANEGNQFERHLIWLTSFFKLDNSSELIKSVLVRYAEANEGMARISVGTNQEDIYDRLINTLVSAKRCYSNAEYIACIELCALHGEMLANYLCITDKDRLDEALCTLSHKDKESIKYNNANGIYFSDGIPQAVRLRWLFRATIITLDDRKRMFKVHRLRIKYFHHWSSKRINEKSDAMDALVTISPVTAKYLEILGDQPPMYNMPNLDRVKKYMEIVTDEPQACIPPASKPVYCFFVDYGIGSSTRFIICNHEFECCRC